MRKTLTSQSRELGFGVELPSSHLANLSPGFPGKGRVPPPRSQARAWEA